jgi:hypothetical protein
LGKDPIPPGWSVYRYVRHDARNFSGSKCVLPCKFNEMQCGEPSMQRVLPKLLFPLLLLGSATVFTQTGQSKLFETVQALDTQLFEASHGRLRARYKIGENPVPYLPRSNRVFGS